MPSSSPTGVLLMAYGGPNCLADVEPYLLDVRGGRPTPAPLVEEVKQRYALIGGRSPLLDVTVAQASELEARLTVDGDRAFRVYAGMRHWQPRIRDAVARLVADGVRRAVALVLAPHAAPISTGAYYRALDEALTAEQARIEFARVERWHTEPGLIDALVDVTRDAVARITGSGPEGGDSAFAGSGQETGKGGLPLLLFTAHSVPTGHDSGAESYDTQLRETSSLVARSLGWPGDRWQVCYQSAGRRDQPWLGPSIDDALRSAAARGERRVVVVPAGFISDHVEVLYDVDIAARGLAASLNMRLERSASLNTHPALIDALADVIRSRLTSMSGADST